MKNFNNYKYNQILKSDFALLFVFIIWTLVLSVAALSSDSQNLRRELAIKKAESLAFQLLQMQRTLKPQQREIASERPSQDKSQGFLGKDPWGDAYRYKVLKNRAGEAQSIVVWSDHLQQKILLKVQ